MASAEAGLCAACQDQNLKARTSEFPDIDNEPQLLAKGTAE
jgi:hypothetical protein